ncbi:hypothetical protein B0T14DRAFT_565186 [Immersiella caudata]|uniref:Uncharacterized protein n=1 Tax=Immersiella caudata TaxID=314043 RepID=A0AA40C3P6_9PEZI|nr:hypothetical protein B0T14DRAFT_565186 [Immersiella caudata]
MIALIKHFAPLWVAPFPSFLLIVNTPLASAATDMDFESSNGTSYAANHPFLAVRGLGARDQLQKRQQLCNTGDLYCLPPIGRCCITDYSCCGATFCCPPGYACNAGLSCYLTDVVTVSFFLTQWVTSTAVSTVYTGTSTSWSTLELTNYQTVTSHSRGGVSTSTIWVTITTTQILKRALPTPTPVLSLPSPFAMQRQVPLLVPAPLQKRAVTIYETWVRTSISTTYSYYTIRSTITSVTTAAVESTRTSVIVDDATSTTTVTSTTISAVVVQQGQQQQQSSGGSSGLTTASIVGIAVSVGCSVLGLIFAVGFRIWKYRKGGKKDGVQG